MTTTADSRSVDQDVTLNPVTAINVKDAPYYAKGDGVTDDAAALQMALDAVGTRGGAVYFPPGDYLVTKPLAPRSRTLMFGSHVPKWIGQKNPQSACKIRLAPTFAGSGMIVPPNDTVALALRNLALVGDGVGVEGRTGFHGLRMPDLGYGGGDASWRLQDVTIAGFGGSGIYGRVHVALIDGCYIHNNGHCGIYGAWGQRWNDVFVSNCFLFYNTAANVYFGHGETSSGVSFVNCRFERAGGNPDDVFKPLNGSAPGVRLANARMIEFVNCSTDANCGSGFHIVHEAGTGMSPPYRPDHIYLVNCRLNRDGTGGNVEPVPSFAGLDVKGSSAQDVDMVSHVKCVNCVVTYGLASDEGKGSVLGPKFGVRLQNTNYFQWIGGSVSPSTQAQNNDFVAYDKNYAATLIDVGRGLMTLPTSQPNTRAFVPDGAAYFDPAASALRMRHAGAWKSAQLA